MISPIIDAEFVAVEEVSENSEPSTIGIGSELETTSAKLDDVVKDSFRTNANGDLYIIQLSDIKDMNAYYAMPHGLKHNYYGTGKREYNIDKILKDKDNYRLTDHMLDFMIMVETNDGMTYKIDVGRWMYPVPVEQILGSKKDPEIPEYNKWWVDHKKHNIEPIWTCVPENETLKLISIYYPEDGYVKVVEMGGYIWLEAQNNDKAHPHLNKTFVIQLNEYYLNYLRAQFYEYGYWGDWKRVNALDRIDGMRMSSAWSRDNLDVHEQYYRCISEDHKFGTNPILTDKPDHYLDPWLKGSKYSYVNGIPQEELYRIEKEKQAKAEQYWKDREKARRDILSALFGGKDLDAACAYYRQQDAKVFGKKSATKDVSTEIHRDVVR